MRNLEIDKIKKLAQQAQKVSDMYTDIYMAAISGNTEEAMNSLFDASMLCDTMRNKTESIILSSDKYEPSSDNENALHATFTYEPDMEIFYMAYEGCLPPRPDSDYGRFSYNSAPYKKAVKSTFHSFFKDRKKIRYEKPVLVHFILHYEDKSKMRDNDNVEPKPIIDEISYYMIGDDSPLNVSLMIEGKVDGKNMVEVFVLPKDNISAKIG